MSPHLQLCLLLPLLACQGEPAAPPVPEHHDALTLGDGARVPTTAMSPALRTCLHDACAQSPDRAAFDLCRAERCEPSTERWSIVPTGMAYDRSTGTLRVQAQTRYEPGATDGEQLVRAREAWVGVTAITTAGEEIDLAVQTLFPGRFSEELLFLAEVGPDVQDVVFGVWNRKVEPCDVARSGCRNFGFVLDGSLATWPLKLYADGRRQRILPPRVQLQPRYGGGPVAEFEATLTRATEALSRRAAPLGAEVELLPPVLAPRPLPSVHWAYAHPGDALLVEEVAASFPSAHHARLDGPDFAFTSGAATTEQAWTCAQRCAGGSALLACLTTSCKL